MIFISGTNRYFRKVASRLNIQTSFVDMTDAASVQKAIKPTTKVCYLSLVIIVNESIYF